MNGFYFHSSYSVLVLTTLLLYGTLQEICDSGHATLLERVHLISTVSIPFSIKDLSAILQKEEIKMNKLALVSCHHSV